MSINVMGDVPNSPVEVVEMRYPLRIERFGLRAEVSGHGQYRGGAGIYRDYHVLEDGVALFSALENTRETIAAGAYAGADGGPAQVVINPETEKEWVLNDRGPFPGQLQAGDIISMRSGGGGGWGDAKSRDPEQVVADVRDDLISIDEARDIYRVAVDIDGTHPVLNKSKTEQLRASG